MQVDQWCAFGQTQIKANAAQFGFVNAAGKNGHAAQPQPQERRH
jgi:hypothetical protein